MKIELHNIGILEKATITLDGLTVITGLNDSGKSTVGKTLYSLYHGMNFYQDSIERDRIRYLVTPFLRKIDAETSVEDDLRREHLFRKFTLQNLIEEYLEDVTGKEISYMQKNLSQLDSKIEFFLREAGFTSSDITSLMDEFSKRSREVLQSSFLLKVKKNVVRQTFMSEFAGQYVNLFQEGIAYIDISDNSSAYHVKLSDDEIYGLEQNITESLNFEDVVLIDTPMILNNVSVNSRFWGLNYINGHQQELIKKVMDVSSKLKSDNIVESSVAREQIGHLNHSIKKIEKILKGNLSIEDDTLFYEINKKRIKISSLASGLKTYVICKRLIDNGYLNRKTLLIIDEPEVHLHPEWQINFAEILVLLQQEIGIHVLLTTHSPYFLQAIDVYSRKHGIERRTHFYLANRMGDSAVLEPIDGKLEETYKMLAEPFIMLRDMENDMQAE